MLIRNTLTVALLSILTVVSLRNSAAAEPRADQIEFFENRIRPVLVDQCYECHNSTKNAESGLALDQREASLKGRWRRNTANRMAARAIRNCRMRTGIATI